MTVRKKIQQKIDWHKAELEPDFVRRQWKRASYDTKYNTCRQHGSHPANECPGSDASAPSRPRRK